MKKYIVIITLLVSTISLFGLDIAKNYHDDGSHVFETTIDYLVSNNITEEIELQNNSSFSLTNLDCQIKINGKTHTLKTMPRLLIGKDESFDGYKDDDLKDELKYHFGNDGRFTTANTNTIVFIFSFGKHDTNVIINKVYKNKKDICFEIIDNPNNRSHSEKK